MGVGGVGVNSQVLQVITVIKTRQFRVGVVAADGGASPTDAAIHDEQ